MRTNNNPNVYLVQEFQTEKLPGKTIDYYDINGRSTVHIAVRAVAAGDVSTLHTEGAARHTCSMTMLVLRYS